MAFVPGFKNDIFVSYAHVDDEPFPGTKEGWVTTLIKGLRAGLSQKLGRSDAFELWVDHKLSRNVKITPQIMEMIQQSATLLVILSPGYLASDWCQREADTFLRFIEDRARSGSGVFLVESDKVEYHRRPSELKGLMGYSFWVQDGEGSPPRTLGFPKPNPDDYRYYDKLNELSSELAKELQAQKRAASESGPPPPVSGPTVFLAEATDDLDAVRDEVRRHLDQAGIRVLPKSWYSREPIAFKSALEADLQKCDLFVQLLSETVGKKAPDLPRGYAGLQFECAKKADKKIMQWHSRELVLDKIQDKDQLALLQGDSVMAVGIEEFKRDVVKRASEIATRAEKIGNIFISYSRKDQKYVRELSDYLENKGLSVWVDDRIDYGDRWWQTIVANIRNCSAMVVVMSSESEKTKWVEREMMYADNINKPIFPLLLKGDCFPFFVNQQYHDVRDGSMPPKAFIERLRQHSR